MKEEHENETQIERKKKSKTKISDIGWNVQSEQNYST